MFFVPAKHGLQPRQRAFHGIREIGSPPNQGRPISWLILVIHQVCARYRVVGQLPQVARLFMRVPPLPAPPHYLAWHRPASPASAATPEKRLVCQPAATRTSPHRASGCHSGLRPRRLTTPAPASPNSGACLDCTTASIHQQFLHRPSVQHQRKGRPLPALDYPEPRHRVGFEHHPADAALIASSTHCLAAVRRCLGRLACLTGGPNLAGAGAGQCAGEPVHQRTLGARQGTLKSICLETSSDPEPEDHLGDAPTRQLRPHQAKAH